MPKPTSDCRATERNHPWPMVRLGELGVMVRGNGIKRCETIETGCPCLRYGEIYTSFNVILDKPRSFVPKELFDKSVKIKKGDLVFTLTGENTEEIAKALAYLGDGEIAAGGDLAVWTGHGCDSKYLAYLMYSPQLISQKAATGNGNIVVHTSIKKLQQLEIPLPSLPVQREIVARLERELAAVEKMKNGFEALAETAKQEFKAELKEVFEGLKSGGAEIGTDGTNGTVETRRLGEIGRVVTGTTPSKGNKSYYGGEWPFYKPADLNQGRNTIGSGDSLADAGWQSARQLPANSVLVTCIGATLGKTGIIRREGSCNQQINAIVCDGKTLPEYVYYSILSPQFQNMLWQSSNSTTLPMVNKSTFEKFEIPFPALAVQREVVARLDLAKARAEKLEAKAREGVSVCETMRKAILKEAFE